MAHSPDKGRDHFRYHETSTQSRNVNHVQGEDYSGLYEAHQCDTPKSQTVVNHKSPVSQSIPGLYDDNLTSQASETENVFIQRAKMYNNSKMEK